MRPPRLRYPLDRKAQKAVGRRAAPLRIAGRKMRADIAVGERAENGVGQRMQGHIGVGVTDQGLRRGGCARRRA